MLGFEFVRQGFLFAGLAAAIPIAIHLLLKQRARRIEIGSVRFLQRVLREHNRMHRIRQWLLLAARVVVALLLALLFARPYFDRTAIDASQREVVLLLDRSGSMQMAGGRGGMVLDEAYQALMDYLEQQHENTIVHVATCDANSIQEVDWRQNRSAPEPGYAGTDYAKALAWARDLLQPSVRSDQEVVLFTDLQRAGLGHSQLGDFPANIRVGVRDVGKPLAKNIAITRATAVATEIRPKLPPKIDVEIRNDGPLSIDQVFVQLSLQGPSGAVDASQKVELPAASQTQLVFELPDLKPGLYQGHVDVDHADVLLADNRRYLAFEARLPDRVLLVDGDESSSVFGSETYFLEIALQLGQDASSRELPSFETERIVWENGEGFPSLQGFRVIVLANVGRFSSDDANRLRDYLQQGGRLLMTCGDRFNRRAAAPLAAAGLLPADVGANGDGGPGHLANWQKDHPVFRLFDDPQYGDLRQIRFEKIAPLRPLASATVLAETRSGEPLLVERRIGDGCVMLLASTVDTAWTDWPRQRLYVPLVRQLLFYLTDQHLRENQVVDVPATGQPGIDQDGDRIRVANMDPAESELARLTPTQFRESLKLPEPDLEADLTPEEAAALAPPAGSELPNELWPWIAWLLLAWLLLETFLAGQVHA